MFMSESMDADVIWISQSWSEFLVLLIVQHSHVVSEHVVDQVSVIRINSLVNIVLIVSSIHGIPTEVVFIEIIRLNEHVIERTNVNVWADVASLSVEDLLDVSQDLLDASIGVIESEESTHAGIHVCYGDLPCCFYKAACAIQQITFISYLSIVIWHK